MIKIKIKILTLVPSSSVILMEYPSSTANLHLQNILSQGRGDSTTTLLSGKDSSSITSGSASSMSWVHIRAANLNRSLSAHVEYKKGEKQEKSVYISHECMRIYSQILYITSVKIWNKLFELMSVYFKLRGFPSRLHTKSLEDCSDSTLFSVFKALHAHVRIVTFSDYE